MITVLLNLRQGMLEWILNFVQSGQFVEWVDRIKNNEGADWSGQVPVVAHPQQMKEAYIQIGIKPSYLTHKNFYRVPLVKLQNQRIVYFGFDSMHNGDLPDHC